jgi:hypothetical protein
MGLVAVLTLCCLASTPTIRHGTAIAAIRVPSELVIAADSRVIDGLNRGMPDACKIRVTQDTVFTVHGMSTDSETGFDLFGIISNILRGGGNLSVAVANVAASVTGPLTRALERLRRDEPSVFQRNAIEMAPVGVILGRYARGAPRLGYVRFITQIERDNRIRIDPQVRICPGADCQGGVAGVFVGPGDAAEAFQKSHPEY